MSKLLDLIAQQKNLAAEIEKLQQDEKEMKVFELVKDLEELRDKYAYSEADFVGVVLSYYKHETPLKSSKTGVKRPRKKQDQYSVVIDNKDVILQEKKSGKPSQELKDLGFTKNEDYIASLIKRFEAKDFADLIEKLQGTKI
ncbi:TPA: hypothetical protein ONB34_007029 [Pseudomonas aeruginosa]|nr:hypothetical protein [Pseudomonas aeruginosa]HBO3874469.1 hypothetical protein [Pseudomonas aeruginosa]HCR1467928.1 hypothetical protein [Pseudomonas aeruginosa]HCR1474176.1 hypothetical protein [Pseudomonas aeruginosa]HCR1803194.1 hypothetical protein [Pseudomonas aeruginosa]